MFVETLVHVSEHISFPYKSGLSQEDLNKLGAETRKLGKKEEITYFKAHKHVS